MHKAVSSGANLTDSMRMFMMGLEGGKPPAGEVGVQPEWFFGTATLSFSDAVETHEGDVFEIEADAFTFPVRNPLARQPVAPISKVRVL